MFLPSNITLKFGDSGDFVSELQRRLTAVHCFSGDPSGFYDGVTVNSVSQFQAMSGIRSDGIAGPETLRRLNGVISGDTSTTDHKAEEEQRLAQEAEALRLNQQYLLAEQQAQLAAQPPTQPEPVAEVQQQHHQTPQLPEVNYVQQQAYDAQQHQQQHLQQQNLLNQQQQQQQSAAADLLAQMLLTPQQLNQNAQPQHQGAHQAQPIAGQPPQAHAPHHAAHEHAGHAAAIPVTNLAPAAPVIPVAAIAPQAPAAPLAPAALQQAQAPAAAEQPRGLVGRAMQYASDVVQKLANYFESKLPAHVLDEVKDIGATMAKSGVKEAAIPMGPEQQRGVDAPARGPQQQQAIQRG